MPLLIAAFRYLAAEIWNPCIPRREFPFAVGFHEQCTCVRWMLRCTIRKFFSDEVLLHPLRCFGGSLRIRLISWYQDHFLYDFSGLGI